MSSSPSLLEKEFRYRFFLHQDARSFSQPDIERSGKIMTG
jgi:hypothetical protein